MTLAIILSAAQNRSLLSIKLGRDRLLLQGGGS